MYHSSEKLIIKYDGRGGLAMLKIFKALSRKKRFKSLASEINPIKLVIQLESFQTDEIVRMR